MPNHILVADDDPHIREVICFALEKAGLSSDAVADGAAVLRRFAEKGADLIVLDVGMPEMDGLEVCRQLRRSSNVPILFLSARDEEIDRILGLEMGGDDYVTKPFSPRELVARVHAVLRRLGPAKVAEADAGPFSHGLLKLSSGQRLAWFGDSEVRLTAIEFAMLESLTARPAHVLTRGQLLGGRPNIHVSDRTIDSHIRNIRAKFAAAGGSDVVETVHGVGFRLGRCGA
ncbi:response regulator transcription factor [Mesorhizobium retamae]|uniref:Response regulator transcription factor n=1 Tax=Mesorhizobium retamae TaxID=2912854 RepID=A0ABS9QNP1_9HYPH|nr:response regulator transcription factor [Mesorhizobium sp. IRAMC:0171]MCG7509027.1 response regulator transcription factor [Mesorhizobium sp. IRAMC:0171]